jgi:drug efflux transport system permease protein
MRERLLRIRELVRKEWRQMFRDPRMKQLIFVSPIVQLIVFGYAVNTDVRYAPLLFIDRDRTAESRGLAEVLESSGEFRVVRSDGAPGAAARGLDRGEVLVVVEVPPQFSRDLGSGQPVEVQVLVDGTHSMSANLARGAAAQVIESYVRRGGPTNRAIPAAGGGLEMRPQAWYNPDLKSRVYNVPAVAGVLLMLMALLLTSMAVVRERELGTLEQLMVSPLSPGELILGKTIPVAAVALMQLVLVISVARLWFGVPFRGNPLVLLLGALLYILSGLGIGLLISTVSRTQQEAFMAMFLIFLPAMLLSGFMFPVASMPVVFQYLTLLNPIRHFLDVVRGVFLRGAGLDMLWPQFLALGLLAAALLTLATRRFRKRLT